MKKTSIIFFVLSILMTMTQCKKTQVIPTEISDSVYINLDLNDGSKADVNVTNGIVTFERYDVLYVVSEGKYVGTLSHNGTNFAGEINGAVVDKPLYFYFFGNQRVDNLKPGESESCVVSIEDQTKDLPVISCGISEQVYDGEGYYSTFLYNKCALVKFNVISTMSDEYVCINGMNNVATIDFKTGSFVYGQDDGGIIKMSAGSGEKWAILFPNNEIIAEGADGSAFSADYRYIGKRPSIKQINVNDFITEAYTITIEKTNVADGMYALGNEKRVIFAKGNVQYIGSAKNPYWKFADNQYDLFTNTAEQLGDDPGVNRDRFGWGTGNEPYRISTSNIDYKNYYDWGKNFPLVDGKEWHAPKCIEWEYVMYTRNATKLNGVYNARFARARITTPENVVVNGVILFPDVYNHPAGVKLPEKSSINYTNNNHGATYSDNDYTAEDWQKMEEAGCVFLPAGGQRIVKGGVLGFYNVNEEGHYWSQCDLGDPEHACNIYYTDYRPYIYDTNDKYKGFSVRLVHE